MVNQDHNEETIIAELYEIILDVITNYDAGCDTDCIGCDFGQRGTCGLMVNEIAVRTNEFLKKKYKTKETKESFIRCEMCGKKLYSGLQIYRYAGMPLCERCKKKRSGG